MRAPRKARMSHEAMDAASIEGALAASTHAPCSPSGVCDGLRPPLHGARPRAPGETTGESAGKADDDARGDRDLVRQRRPDRERDHAEYDAEDSVLGDGSYHGLSRVQTARHVRRTAFFST